MKFLIIQTAFIGDVILATPLLENLHAVYPDSKIDFLLRKGNEDLFTNHPFINELIIWNKKEKKYRNFLKIIRQVRRQKYDYVINIQRFASSGIITALSGSKNKIGFNKNPLSFLFTFSAEHIIGNENPKIHEVDRNLALIKGIKGLQNLPLNRNPRLYISEDDAHKVKIFKSKNYICIAPASVWFTKQYPADKWIDFIKYINNKFIVYLIGGKNDFDLCNIIIDKLDELAADNKDSRVYNHSGKLTYLQTASLMKDAMMNYVNDSAPLHIASSVNAPVSAIFCSTVPAFGFGPLSDNSAILEIEENLYCRPCGLHGYKACPEKHFRCAYEIKTEQLIKKLEL